MQIQSVLSSMVIDHLMGLSGQTDITVIFFYVMGNSDMQHLPTRVVSTFIQQPCRHMTTLPDEVLDFYHKFTQNARKPLFDDLQDLFDQCRRHFKHVFLVLDDLDECDQNLRRPILDFICAFGTQGTNVKILVTSREEHDIERTFFSRHGVSRLEIGLLDVRNDIARFVRHQVMTDLEHIKAELQEEVIKTLTERSGGMFLWVSLQPNDLRQVPEADIKTTTQYATLRGCRQCTCE